MPTGNTGKDSSECSDRTGCNSFKFKKCRFRFVVDAPSLELLKALKATLDRALSNQEMFLPMARGLELEAF